MSRATPLDFHADYAMWSLVLVAGLALLALAIVGYVVLFGRGLTSWGQFASRTAGLWWLVPVVAIGAFVVARAGATFDGRSESRRDAQVRNEMRLIALSKAAERDSRAAATTDANGSAKTSRRDEADPPPEWVSKSPVQHGETKLVVVSSLQYATVEEAERDADRQAVELLKQEFHASHPYQGEWAFPPAAVDFRLRHDEEISRQTENATFTVYRVHKQLAITPEARKTMETAWRQQVGERRLWSLGGIVAFLALVTGATSAYLRLDGRTAGQYRGRLKLAAVSAVVAGGLAVAMLV